MISPTFFANYEYEVDELRCDTRVLQEATADAHRSFHVSLHHDQTVMEPDTMLTENGKPMKVFTPYHRAWLAEVKYNPRLLGTVPVPSRNSADATKTLHQLCDSKPPTPPKEKQFADESERKRIRSLWPAGHGAAVQRLKHFLTDKIGGYAATRSNPAQDSTSRLSAYFAARVLSVRETLSAVRRVNKGSDFSQSGSSYGIASWVREIVFRELYRQSTLTTPHTAMSLPQNLKFDFVHWEDDQEGYDRWERGTLGVPFVDTGMRQIKHEAYIAQ